MLTWLGHRPGECVGVTFEGVGAALVAPDSLCFRGSTTMKVTPSPALVRLERKLARDRRAILSAADVHLLDSELRRALVASFPDLPAEALERSEDTIRWYALGQRCQEARGARGLRDVSAGSGIPLYRLRAVENGLLSEIRADLARRYFSFLGIEDWVARWCRANKDLAARAEFLTSERRAPQPRKRRASPRRVSDTRR